MTFKETLLQQAIELFKKNGVSDYTMQDLAKALDISQATFDDFFESMEDLVLQAVNYQTEVDRNRQKEYALKAENALEELLYLIQDGLESLKNLNPKYVSDIMSYPSVQKKSMQDMENYSYPMIHNIINKGVQQGVFLKDINIAVVTRVIIENLNVLLNTRVFPPEKYSIREVYRSIYLYYFRGLCTTEAIANAERLLSKSLSS
ncbi:MAG: TetR/AcrR family transcriptional regulator [Bacteroidia bacterium]